MRGIGVEISLKEWRTVSSSAHTDHAYQADTCCLRFFSLVGRQGSFSAMILFILVEN